MRIYCDTDVLPHNIVRHIRKLESKPKTGSERELEALRKELAAVQALECDHQMMTSQVVYRELVATSNEVQREALVADHRARIPIPADEATLGFHNQSDQYGGWVCCPLISDVQDEDIRAELIRRGLKKKDPWHITQAVCNDCDVFLTRDVNSIIKSHRSWLEERFPSLKIRRPSEMIAELTAATREGKEP